LCRGSLAIATTPPPPGPKQEVPLRLSPEAAEHIRSEIARARGREVCFLARVAPTREIVEPRAVARGNQQAVLAAARDATQGEVMIHNHPSGGLAPSEADLGVASHLYELGIGTAITDNSATELYVVVEPPRPRERVRLNVRELTALLEPGGALSNIHPGYEDRPEQRDVMEVIADRYNEGGVSIVEAGTGTGKSLAYLLPAARWAMENGERTVISTNTINLQEQLVSKDLPVVSQILGDDVRWALMKGRGNYVSIRRLELAAGSLTSLFEEDRSEELDRLSDWVGSTEDGSLSDLSFAPTPELWEEVQSDSDACLRARCRHFQECFYHSSRRRAASAELLVVNHHLLFTDVSIRRGTGDYGSAAVLPAYKHLIIDEAHNVEDAATSHLGGQLTRRGLYRLLSRLSRKGKGVLHALSDELGGSDEAEQIRQLMVERLIPGVARVRKALDEFFSALEGVLPEGLVEPTRVGAPPLNEPLDDPRLSSAYEQLLPVMGAARSELTRVRLRIEEREEIQELVEGRLLDVRAAERRLESAQDVLRMVLDSGAAGSDVVRWIERRGRAPRFNTVLLFAPIELGPVLRESLFDKIGSVSLLSATLATAGTFDFIRGRLGLAAEGLPHTDRREAVALAEPQVHPVQVVERLVHSPFNYGEQSLLCVPTDFPPASAQGPFQDATARAIQSVARSSAGGVMALFTSYRALRRVAQILRAGGIESEFPVYVQGEERRTRMLRAFEASGRGILLGTSSFWEGVDVPGDPLRALVLEKLPFRVPTEPVTAARLQAIEARGGNSFWSYMLPLAALRLKQGFGRLIRSRTDRGVIVLLDDRFLTKRYGRLLQESLPPAPLVKGPWAELEERIGAFYSEHRPRV